MLKASIEDIMTEDIVTLGEGASVTHAAHTLLRFQINGLLMVSEQDHNKVTGILTTTDLLRLLDKALLEHGRTLLVLDTIGKLPIKDVASKNVIKVQRDAKLGKVIAIMHKKNVHTIPVYDGEKLVGVIGRHDILNAAFYSTEELNRKET